MRTLFTKLAVAASFLLYSSGAMAQCLTAANTWTDLNGAGGAPCFDGTTCAITDPDFTTAGFGVFSSEAYLLDNVNQGSDYVFSMCQGIGAGAWIPSITIVAPSGAVDVYNAGSTGDFAANCSISWTASESGTYSIVIHEAGVACGVANTIDNGNPTVTCGGNPAPCTILPCEAGVLDISSSPLTLCPGETFDMVTDGSESTNGAYAIFISPQAGATGGLEGAIFLSPVQSFPVTGIDNDLGGLLSAGSLPPLVGTFAFYTLSYNDVNDDQGSVCSISEDSLMVTFLTANDAACIPCTADAGTITAVETPVCFLNGSAVIAGTPDGNSLVPAGYSTGYAVTDASGTVIQVGLTPSFTVTAVGSYTIHTLVYDPTTLNPLALPPGITAAQANALLIQGGGTICASLDLVGAPIVVEVCATCDADAGTLTAVASPVCVTNGSGTIAATANGDAFVPAGYTTGYAVTDANGTVVQVGLTPSFTVTAAGNYTIHTLVYDPNTLNPLALPPGTTAAEVNALLIQGGGTICASLDLVGAPVEAVVCVPCIVDAGTITADASPVCLANGSADISATPDGNVFIDEGYQTLYVLTEGAGLVIVGASATPNFTVTAGGDYTIHTLIYDPLTLDISIVQFGVTTGFDVNGLLQQGGGVICGSLDVAGAPITVEAPDAGTLSAGAQTCLVNGSGTVSATPDGNTNVPAGYSVGFALTDALGNVLQVGLTPSFPVTAVGFYTVHTLVYDPNTLNPLALPPGITAAQANALLVQGGGTICASLDLVGATVEVIACTQCDADAGTITSDASPVCFENGTADISATGDGNAVVPAGYSTLYVLTEGSGLVIVDASATPNFTVTATGDYTIHTLVFDPLTLDISIVQFGVTTGFDVNSLLQQGGGVICASLDVAGAPIVVEVCVVPCTASAGTITADASPVCLTNGSADISATANGNAVVPSGYQTLYVLTQGSGLVIVDAQATPDFTVNAAGNYTIHTLVYDPTTLDVSIVQFGVTTGFQVNALLQQGGGLICASLDVVGAPIVVQNCSTGCNVTAGTLITSSSLVCLFEGAAVLAATHIQTPTYPIGYEVLYILTEGAGLVVQDSYIFPTFTVTAGGNYTIHTLVYDPLILDPATIGTGVQLNSLLLQGGGTICGALDVAGAAITVPVLESTVGVLLNDGDSLYLENATGLTDYQWFLNGNPIPGAIGSSYVIEESGNYAVQYTGENGCIQSSSTSPFTFSGGNIGFEEHDLFSAVSVFPNPSNGLFSVRTELKNRTDVTISITDVTGRVLAPSVMLQDVSVFNQAMDVSHLSAGFYLVRIEASEGGTTVRFVKQ